MALYFCVRFFKGVAAVPTLTAPSGVFETTHIRTGPPVAIEWNRIRTRNLFQYRYSYLQFPPKELKLRSNTVTETSRVQETFVNSAVNFSRDSKCGFYHGEFTTPPVKDKVVAEHRNAGYSHKHVLAYKSSKLISHLARQSSNLGVDDAFLKIK